jgi:hypothetical protein
VNHILVQCPYSRMVWFRCFQETGLQIEQPQMDSRFESWWSRVRLNVRERNRRKFDALIILIGRKECPGLWQHSTAMGHRANCGEHHRGIQTLGDCVCRRE